MATPNSPGSPDFGPGQGWHKIDGYAAPGSVSDRQAMRQRAYPCYVLRLRWRGAMLPTNHLLATDPIRGGLLMMSAGDAWSAHLFVWPEMTHEILFLAWARLVREHDGCRQYQGIERESGTPKWPQTWLCTPTAERAMQIVEAMAGRKTGQA